MHAIVLPRWRSGHAVACRATTLRFKSGPWLRRRLTRGCAGRKSEIFDLGRGVRTDGFLRRRSPIFDPSGDPQELCREKIGDFRPRNADAFRPSSVIAARAAGLHPDPSRTRKLSPSTWCAVLRYESSREPLQAAITSLSEVFLSWIAGTVTGWCRDLSPLSHHENRKNRVSVNIQENPIIGSQSCRQPGAFLRQGGGEPPCHPELSQAPCQDVWKAPVVSSRRHPRQRPHARK
jgi:hypothetical protein